MAESENNILHNHVLIGLFKETFLVDLSSPAPAEEVSVNPKQVEVLVLHQDDNNSLSPSQQNLLQAILTACKLETTQVKIFGKSFLKTSPLQNLLENHHPKKIILFGVDPSETGLPMHFPVFQIQAHQDVQYLHAPGLGALETDKQLKLLLWQKLKQLFP